MPRLPVHLAAAEADGPPATALCSRPSGTGTPAKTAGPHVNAHRRPPSMALPGDG
jgi:hypothetical protein